MEVITKKTKASAPKSGLIGIPSHGVADGVGALVGAVAAGAAVGTIAGPVGTVLGALTGAVAGGLGADALVNSVDEVREDAHWRENYRSRPYVAEDASYDDLAPAYRHGVVSFTRYPDQQFDAVEADLSDAWESARGPSTLVWEDASPAARDAWDRLATLRTTGGSNRR